MKKKAWIKVLKQAVCVAGCILMLSSPAFGAEAVHTNTGVSPDGKGISLFSYEYEWRYKNVNGAAYKRLYNMTLDRWEGDWVRV